MLRTLTLLLMLTACGSPDWRDEKLPDLSGDKGYSIAPDCMETCLSVGKNPYVCDTECGAVRDEGVFYDPTYNPRQQLYVKERE